MYSSDKWFKSIDGIASNIIGYFVLRGQLFCRVNHVTVDQTRWSVMWFRLARMQFVVFFSTNALFLEVSFRQFHVYVIPLIGFILKNSSLFGLEPSNNPESVT